MTDYSSWVKQLIANLDRFGPEAEEALERIARRRTRIGVHEQPTGARWTIDRRIEIHPRFVQAPPDDPYAASLIIHEVRHLNQGPLVALSVYGEMEAWQLQFGFLKAWTGRYHRDAAKSRVLEELMSLPLGWNRSMLSDVRRLMQQYAGRQYRIDLLPLYPLPDEIRYRLTRKEPAR